MLYGANTFALSSFICKLLCLLSLKPLQSVRGGLDVPVSAEYALKNTAEFMCCDRFVASCQSGVPNMFVRAVMEAGLCAR